MSLIDKVYITPAGYYKLLKELTVLKDDRPARLRAISDASNLKDLSENAEYQEEKRKHAEKESRISYLQSIAAVADVISPPSLPTAVVFGCAVTVLCEETGDETRYTIVGSYEADASDSVRWISVESPMGKAMLGKKIGDYFEIITGRGVSKFFTVKKIEPGAVEAQERQEANQDI